MISVTEFSSILNYFSNEELNQLEAALGLATTDEQIMDLLAANNVFSKFLKNDPLIKAMSDANKNGITWGDLMLMAPAQPSAPVMKECLEEDWEWTMPTLTLRKDIWNNFPAIVDRITGVKGECYSIMWHRSKYEAARDACEHGWEIMDFDEDMERRILKSLNASSSWTVHAPRNNKEVCYIRMNFGEEEPVQPVKPVLAKPIADLFAKVEAAKKVDERLQDPRDEADAWTTVGYAGPVLNRIVDLRNHFPVVWNEVAPQVFAINFNMKKVREANINTKNAKTDLLDALKHAKFCTLLPAADYREACRIRINA